MAIKQLQKRLTQVGVIRLGEQLISKKTGKPYPSKLETLRITSPSKQLIDAVATLYGGEVKPWKAPTGPQWEVVTDAKEVPVLVPAQRIDPNLEHWGNGYQDRICDGEVEKIRNVPCLCAAAQLAGRPFGPRDVCKPTTRMSLMLAEVPSLGTFKLESKGWNAAAELPMLADSIEKAPEPVPARLVVEKRDKNIFHPDRPEKDQIEARVFMVPVLLFDWLTPAQAFGGELGTAARAALGAAAVEKHSIEAAKSKEQRPKLTADDVMTLAGEAEKVEQVQDLWRDANRDGVLTDDLKATLKARAADLAPKPKADKPAAGPALAEDVVDAEVADDPDAIWLRIQAAAGERGWDTESLEGWVTTFLGKSSMVADAFELTKFLTAVEAGEVA